MGHSEECAGPCCNRGMEEARSPNAYCKNGKGAPPGDVAPLDPLIAQIYTDFDLAVSTLRRKMGKELEQLQAAQRQVTNNTPDCEAIVNLSVRCSSPRSHGNVHCTAVCRTSQRKRSQRTTGSASPGERRTPYRSYRTTGKTEWSRPVLSWTLRTNTLQTVSSSGFSGQ